ncbi:MAG: DUF1761 domain-containing protein [Myxococcales bacterium]|nr:DUF1761 domain-containing protein [Myxococcales bacterium]
MDPARINWLSVVAAAAATFLLGGVWYSPILFGRAWQSLVGLSDADLKKGVARAFGGAALCASIGATNLAFFLGPDPSIAFGVGAGAAAGVGWVATALTTTFLFERRKGTLIAIDAGYHAVSYTMMGAIIAALS